MEKIIMTTMCVIYDPNKDAVLMINRAKGDWDGYAPPGGHVEFPESIADCAIREVKEETGLDVWDLNYKGVAHFVNEDKNERFLVFNFITDKFAGELLKEAPEGKLEWVCLADLDKYALPPDFKERLELFFKDYITEMHVNWDASGWRNKRKIPL